jgi:glucose-1-phosphate adenylyltransferase
MSEMRDAIGVLLAGGQGERLWPLTRDRAKPAVPFGGLYRIIDITLSNCINSDLRRIFVLTQYKALSLNRHIRAGWSPLMGLGDYIEVLPPQMRVSNQWYLGTADAVYQNIESIITEDPEYTLILSGDHIYKMDYNEMISWHQAKRADVTIATIRDSGGSGSAKQFGVVEVDKQLPRGGLSRRKAAA